MTKKKTAAKPAKKQAKSPKVARVIGVGSSAGGLEAIRELAANLPDDIDCAYIVVQHMSPQHKSLMTSLIASETKLHVKDVEDGETPKPNVIYVTPPRTDIVMDEGKLTLVKPSLDAGKPKPSVDRFLVSLAQDRGENSMGVILSGTGSDGAYGVQAIREAGGITIAQDDASAKYDGMANSAIETGCIDLVLRPSEIGTHLKKILNSAGDLEQFRSAQDVSTPLSGILQIVLARTRVDFREYTQTTVQRRIERRMTALGIAQIEEYVSHCRNSPTEVDALFRDLLISVTRFFRDSEEFKALVAPIDDLVKRRADQPLRVWVAGCATGEEVYSIAILLAEALGGPSELVKSRTQIFATDIDTNALGLARRGHYPNAALYDVPDHYKEKYFIQQSDGVQVIEALRSAVLFSDHNLCQDPPFLNMDLICCRNLLIYFGSKLQSKVLSRLHYALKPSGYMFLGTAESVTGADQLFTSASERGHIFKRRLVQGKSRMDIKTFSNTWTHKARDTPPVPATTKGKTVDRELFDALARSIGDNAVLVSAEHSFLRVYGDITEFIDLSEDATLDLQLSLLKSPLREEARSITVLALKHGERRVGSRHPWPGGRVLRLDALPITPPGMEERMALLVFNVWPEEADKGHQSPAAPATELSGDYLRELDMELANTREALQQTIEELETSNEELQALNEELQSTNEELQATNEELETSNEELQSTNEELITVNEELQVNAGELTAINAELGSVLGNVPIPLLVLDNALQVTRASGSAIDLFKISTPLQDPHLSQIALPDGFPKLVEICNDALKLGKTLHLDFESLGKTYTLQCAPFSSETGQLIGATLVFIDAPAVRSLTNEITDLLEHAPLHLIRYGMDGVVARISQRTALALGIEAQEAVGRKIDDLLRYSIDGSTGEAVSKIVSNGADQSLVPLREKEGGTPNWLSAERYTFEDPDSGEKSYIITGSDVTRMVEAEAELKHHNELLELNQKNSGIGYWTINLADDTLHWSDAVYAIHGLEKGYYTPELKSAIEAYHPDDRAFVSQAVEAAIHDKSGYDFRCRLIHAKGHTIWVEARARVVTDTDGQAAGLVGTFRDVSAESENTRLLGEIEKLRAIHSMGFFSFDVLATRAHWSKNMWEIMGIDDSVEPGHEAFRAIILEDEQEAFTQMRSSALAKGDSVDAVFNVDTPAYGKGRLGLRFVIGEQKDGEVLSYFGEVWRIDSEGDPKAVN